MTGLSEYERQRLKTIEQNRLVLQVFLSPHMCQHNHFLIIHTPAFASPAMLFHKNSALFLSTDLANERREDCIGGVCAEDDRGRAKVSGYTMFEFQSKKCEGVCFHTVAV